MLATFALALALAAQPVRLAVTNFAHVGVPAETAGFYSEHFANRLLADKRLRVTTPSDMATVIGVQRQKELLGCADNQSACMAELAGALGVDGIVTGQLARVGHGYQLNVKVLAADGSHALFVYSSELIGSEEDLLAEVNRVAVAAAAALTGDSPQEPAKPAVTSTRADGISVWLKLLPLWAGVGIAAAGFGFAIDAMLKFNRLNEPSKATGFTWEEGMQLRDDGKRSQGLAIGLLSAGGACMVASVVWILVSKSPPPIAMAPMANGVAIGGVF
jgi:hypothetical protein